MSHVLMLPMFLGYGTILCEGLAVVMQAEEAGMKVSMFERLQAAGLAPILLDTQYRMHPRIAEFPSQLFYNGLIQSGITAADRPLPLGALPPALCARC